MKRLSPRYLVVGFGQDLSLFLAWAVLPMWAERYAHATAEQLGLLALPGGISYLLGSLFMGRLSDRVTRSTLVRIGLLLFATFCVLAWSARSFGWLLVLAPLGGLGNALIWPPLQARMGDESDAGNLERNQGAFSLAWSSGKMCGFLLAGALWQHVGLDALLGCAALSLALIPVVPPGAVARSGPGAPLVDDDAPPEHVRRGFLVAAWLANVAAYGLGAVVQYLYPDLLASLGRPQEHMAWMLGVMFAAQTVAFWTFGRFSGWRYRMAPLLAWQMAGAAALLVIGMGAPLPWALPAAVVAGIGTGHAYAASVYYSVHSEADRGSRAGVHEALTGAGNSAVPFLGGMLATRSGWALAPYALAGVLVLASVIAQVAVLRRSRTSGAPAA